MVLFQFIPKSGIFGGFQLLGTQKVLAYFKMQSKCTISTFSVLIFKLLPDAISELNTHQNAFAATHCGSLQRSPDPLAAGGKGLTVPLPKTPIPRYRICGPQVFEFQPLAWKKLCIWSKHTVKYSDQCTVTHSFHYLYVLVIVWLNEVKIIVMCNFKWMCTFLYSVVLVPEKPKPEKLPAVQLERRQFTYTRQQWTGKSPKQFLIDWSRKNLPKPATLSFERVEAGAGWWRARCDWLGSIIIVEDVESQVWLTR